MRKQTPIEVRYWEKVAITNDPDDCWNWTAATRNGYGVIGVAGRKDGVEYAHRLAFLMASRFLADNEEVCHACNNRLCQNPRHLYAGTRRDNMAQCARQGRHRGVSGMTWKLVNGKRIYSRAA